MDYEYLQALANAALSLPERFPGIRSIPIWEDWENGPVTLAPFVFTHKSDPEVNAPRSSTKRGPDEEVASPPSKRARYEPGPGGGPRDGCEDGAEARESVSGVNMPPRAVAEASSSTEEVPVVRADVSFLPLHVRTPFRVRGADAFSSTPGTDFTHDPEKLEPGADRLPSSNQLDESASLKPVHGFPNSVPYAPNPVTEYSIPEPPPPSTELFAGIIDPIECYLYRFLLRPEYYAVLVLPLRNLKPACLPRSADLRLLRHVPKCYRLGPDTTEIEWAEGFKDSGPAVEDREFPIFLFGENRAVWARARDLSLFVPGLSTKDERRAVKHFEDIEGSVSKDWIEECRNGLSRRK